VHLQRRTDPQTIARIRELGGEIWDLHQQLAREEILISLAGPVAEAMLMNAELDDPDFWDVFTDDPLADFYHAGELLEALHPEAIDDDNAVDALRSKYVQGTHNLLRRPATWNAVRKVADRLQESGQLDADEATATIEASYSGSRSRRIPAQLPRSV
jgi:hypothetical protein